MVVLSFLLPALLFFAMFIWASIGSLKAARKAFKDNEVVFFGDKIITGKFATILGYVFSLFSLFFGIFALSLVSNFFKR